MNREWLERICARQDLTDEQMHGLFLEIIAGRFSELDLCALLVALKTKGESSDEIAGAARAMRETALPVETGGLAVADSCGTGGDGLATVNISTAAALVVAGAGLPVAKHGNRSVSSRCGSADVLEACGVIVDGDAAFAERCLRELGICFLFAPRYHPGVKHAMPVRKALAMRTLFNLLGPLANPARPKFQVLGVYDPRLCRTMALTLGILGCQRALVVHGGGLDEMALHAETQASFLHDGVVEDLVLTPEMAGLSRCGVEALRGGSPEENGRWLQEILAGRGERAHCDAVALNAGALLWMGGLGQDLRAGTEIALEVLRRGDAAETLGRWAQMSPGGGCGA